MARATCLLVILLLLLGLPSTSRSAGNRKETAITNGGYLVATASPALSIHPDELFIPASSLKLFTSLAALQILGPDYRFQTKLYLDQKKNLYIKGFGDPLLTSERVRSIARLVSNCGVRQIHHLFLDDTAFNLQPVAWHDNTDNPYNATNTALGVNFNSVPFRRQENGNVDSGEPQTPLLPIMQELSLLHPAPGNYRLNVEMATAQYSKLQPSLRYTGELFRAMFKEQSIKVDGGIVRRKVPDGTPELLVFQNDKTLVDAVQECLKYSNNFIANQLFLLCGMHMSGPPATWEKSRIILKSFAQQHLKLKSNQIHFVEGAGLSKANMISARALCIILEHFQPYVDLLPLKKGIPLKSGTMENVFSYAGYLPVNNALVPFAILLNQSRNTRDELLLRLINTLHATPTFH